MNCPIKALLINTEKISLLPPPKLTVSQWADEERYLSSESSSEPGKWDTAKAEYQRGIMDAVSDPEIETVVIMSSAQVGKTEIINNVIGYHIDQEPAPMLIVQPTLRPMAEEWSKNRFAPMVRDTPSLKSKISEAKTRDSSNTITHKTFPGGTLNISGANSPASLAAMPRRIILCDEIDRYPISAGTEGDPVSLAVRRAANFWNRKIILCSTPTVKGASRIENAFGKTDQRKYFIPCPECGHFQILEWKNVNWIKDDDGNHLPETAIFQCSNCSHPIDDVERWDAVQKGEWRATVDHQDKKLAGFFIWAAYSPWTSLQEIVQEFLDKHKNPEQFKTFVNTVWGETFEENVEKVEEESLFGLRERYSDPCPEGVLVLTCSVDVQKDRFEGEVKGWGIGQECWGLDYFIIYGNTDSEAAWVKLYEKLLSKYKHPSGLNLLISLITIDSGYRADYVYRFCKKYTQKRIYATKGKGDNDRPIIGRASYKNKYKAPLFIVGTNAAKERVFSRLNMTLKFNEEEMNGPNPGIMHFPLEYDREYFEQLTAEKVRTKFIRGFETRVWEKNPGARNEALDITVGNFVALEILQPNFKKLKQNLALKIKALKDQDHLVKQTPIKRNAGFVNGWKKY